MRLVVALGGNAFLPRGAPNTLAIQRYNVRRAAASLARLAREHTLVVTHGNGPQIGLLALESEQAGRHNPLDVLGAETEGSIGYLLEQELGNALDTRAIVTLLTRTEVSPTDPAFSAPTKFIGPVYDRQTAESLAARYGWRVAVDGAHWRRIVPSPEPMGIVELGAIAHLVQYGFTVICAGGGGIPVCRGADGKLAGIEAVVDKDLAATLLARCVGADALLLLTDVPGVFDRWGREDARRIRATHPDALGEFRFPAGSMGPKVEAARRFALHAGGRAYIGALSDASALLAGEVGTMISPDVPGVHLAAGG